MFIVALSRVYNTSEFSRVLRYLQHNWVCLIQDSITWYFGDILRVIYAYVKYVRHYGTFGNEVSP